MQHHNIENVEPNQENIARLIENHTDRWDEKKGGSWWIEDFMASNNLWFTDFRKDLARVLTGITPKRLNDLDEMKKYLLSYFKPKLLLGDKPRNIPKQEIKQKPKQAPTVYDKSSCEQITIGAGTKNEAMSRLRKAGYQNKDIASFMGLKPGRVASGIRAYDTKNTNS